MPKLVRTRLSAMMFLFYASLGSWAVTLGTFLMSSPVFGGLNFTTQQVGWIFSTFAFGGMAAPIVVGLLADRLFRAERVLGVASLLAAGFLILSGLWCDHQFPTIQETYRRVAAKQLAGGLPVLEQQHRLDALTAVTGPDVSVPLRNEIRQALERVSTEPEMRRVVLHTFQPLFGLMLAYNFFVQLALTLTNVLCLRNLADPGKEFSRVRMYGTVGWVMAGNTLALVVSPVSAGVLYFAAVSVAALGFYGFTLPATRPRLIGRTLADSFGVKALSLFRDRSFAVFIGVGFVASVMNQFYGVYAHRYLTDMQVPHPERVLTIAQVVEVAVMFLIPMFDPKRRVKWMMTLGLFAASLRVGAMIWGNDIVTIAVAIPLNGVTFGFLSSVTATYLDLKAPVHLRASVQGIVTFSSGGIGVWGGHMLAGWIVESNRVGTTIDWSIVWVVPFIGTALVLILFLLLFRNPSGEREVLYTRDSDMLVRALPTDKEPGRQLGNASH